jgi:hypothetical protein
MNVNLTAGERIRRTKLHELYGGRRQGGISPSRESENVFLITAAHGGTFGYIYDGQADDGFFHYTGEGQVGDQQMTQGNRAIRDHEVEDRELHLFEAHGTELEYLGQYRCHDDYQGDAREVNDGPWRKVIVFRLERVHGTDEVPTRARLDRFGKQRVREIPVEQSLTERMVIDGRTEPYEAERREQRLVRALAARLEGEGHEVCRLQFRPRGEPAPLFCDLYDKTTNTLYESKGTVTRPAVRMGIGQLADYARLIDPAPERVLLLSEEPRPDLLALAASQGVSVTWPNGDGFTEPGEAFNAPRARQVSA